MAKTKIKTPFRDWRVSSERSELYRICFSKGVSVSVPTFVVELTERFPDRARTFIARPGTLADAITLADNYIADNFEVEKPVEERLKDAEAEIVTLKAKVSELETDGFKFRVGKKVRFRADYFIDGTETITEREKGPDGKSRYRRLMNDGKSGVCWWYDDNFVAV